MSWMISQERSAYYALSLDQGDSFSQLANEQAKSTPDAKLYSISWAF